MALKSRVTSRATCSRARVVRVCAHKHESVGVAAASVAAVLLLNAGVAHAGVQLAKPATKKAFFDDGTAAPVVKKAPANPAAAAPMKSAPSLEAKKESEPAEPISAPNISALYIPLALGFIGGGVAIGSKVDDGFSEFLDSALLKKSDEIGAGYENTIKADGGFVSPGKASKGTKKVKAAATEKKFGFF